MPAYPKQFLKYTNNKIYAVGRSQTPEQLTIVKYDTPCQNVIDTNIDNVVARYNISDHVLDASGNSAQLEVSWVDGSGVFYDILKIYLCCRIVKIFIIFF